MYFSGDEGAAEPGDEGEGKSPEGRREPTVTGGDGDGNGEDKRRGGGRVHVEQGEPVGSADEANAAGNAREHPAGQAEFGTDEEQAHGGEEESAVGIQ